MTEEIQELTNWLEDAPKVMATADIQHFYPRSGAWLLKSGVARAVHSAYHAICARCDWSHPVDVDFDPWRGQWGYRCEVSGWAACPPSESTIYEFDMGPFVDTLATAVGANTETRRVVIDGSLYCLGVAGGENPWTALFARRLSDPAILDRVLGELKRPLGKEPGLLITSSDLGRSISMPSGYRLAWLREVVELKDSGLSPRPGLDQFGSRGRRPRQKTGPKSHKAEAREYLKSRRRHGLGAGADGEVGAVIAEMKRRHPTDKLPDDRHVRGDWLAGLRPK